MTYPELSYRYELLRPLGAGGMGEVFLVRDRITGRQCALKHLTTPWRRQRHEIEREFRALAKLRHPTIVSVYECGLSPSGHPYFTMEYAPGIPVDQALEPGDWRGLVLAGSEIAHGLEVLHSANILHGDLKPSNVLAVATGLGGESLFNLRLVDFGLSASLGDDDTAHRGSPGFTAPEIVRGGRLGVASDLYALGATLFTLAAHKSPFEGESVEELLRQQLAAPPDGGILELSGAPRGLIELTLRLMAPEPARRPSGAREVRRELESLLPGSRPSLLQRLRAAVVVGRNEELERIESRLAPSVEGPAAMLILGPAGIGKSALLSEAGRRAALAGHPVVAFTPTRLMELLGTTARASAVLAHHLENLGNDQRTQIPLVLLDDSDALDPLTQRAIREFILDPGSPRAAWIIAQSEDAASDASRMLEYSGVVPVCHLAPISRAAISEMVGARLREPPPQELEEWLWERGQGHPENTVRMLQALAVRGALNETDAGLVVDREILSNFERSSDLISPLLEQISAGAREVLGIVALVGEIAGDEMRAILPDAHAPITELRHRGLINEGPDGTIRIAGANVSQQVLSRYQPDELQPLIAQALRLRSLSTRDRFALLVRAGRVDQALEWTDQIWEGATDPGFLAAMAERLESTHPKEAALWHEKVARQRFLEGRYEAAAPHLRRSIDLSPDPTREPERLYLLSTAYLRIGASEKTAEVLERLLALDLPASILSKTLTNQCAHLRGVGLLEQAEAAGRRAVEIAEAAKDDESLGSATQTLAQLLMSRGEIAKARAMCERALEAHARCGAVLGEIRTRGIRAALAQAEGQFEEALVLYTAALKQARSAGARLAIEELAINQSLLLGELGRWSEVRELNSEAARLALADHRPRNAAIAYINLALADALMGNLSVARREARTAIQLAKRHLPSSESAGWRALAQVERYRGHWRRAARAARHALRLAHERGTATERAGCRLEYGAVMEAQRKLPRALHAWIEAVKETPAGQESFQTLLAARAALVALRLGETGQARLLEPMLSGRATLSPLAVAFVKELEVHRLLAAGKNAETAAAATEMLALFEAIPAPAERARSIVGLMGELQQSQIRPPGGRGWLKWASDEFARLGNLKGRERSLALLVRWLEQEKTPVGRHRDDELLEAVSELLTSLPSLKDLSKKAMELVVGQLDAERGLFFVLEPGSRKLYPMAEHGTVSPTLRRDAIGYSRRVLRQVTRSGGSLLIADAGNDPRANYESVTQLKLQSILCVPLHAAGHVVGAVYLDDSRRIDAFSASDQKLLERIAHLLAIAIDRSYAHEAMTRTNEQLIGENVELRQIAARDTTHQLLGSSIAMRRIAPIISRAAETTARVLISGENGTGKELIARMIHSNSARKLRPFVSVNCGAITDSLLESELFGILPNVATGVAGRVGCFRQADGGTLFLDEIGDMPLRQQVALLAVLANREVTPVGGGRPTKVDVRVIVATNRDLSKMVDAGQFRQDLFFRLNVLPIKVPPLRERKTDIPTLARYFAEQFARGQKRDVPELTSEFLARLMRYDWPGNVRQLQNTIERVMALFSEPKLGPTTLDDDPEFAVRKSPGRHGSLPEQLEEIERLRIRDALEKSGGNQSAAARELGILEQTLRYRMEKYDIAPPRRKARVRRHPRTLM